MDKINRNDYLKYLEYLNECVIKYVNDKYLIEQLNDLIDGKKTINEVFNNIKINERKSKLKSVNTNV